MFLTRAEIVKKDGSPRKAGMLVFSVAFFYFLLWLGFLIQPSGAAELPAKQGSALEEAVSPDGKAAPRDLLLFQRELPPLEAFAGLERAVHRLRRGDTLSKLLRTFGLSREERHAWIRSVRRHYSPRRLRAGREIYLYFIRGVAAARGKKKDRNLKALEIELNENWILTWERGDKAIVFRKRERPYEIEVKTVSGTIAYSLYEDGVRSGLHPAVISQLVDIFAWDIHFNTDLRRGDSFKLHYKRRYRKGYEKKETFRILAAELINRGEKHLAFYFEKEKDRGDYYDIEGRSLSRAFLRFPVEFSRISSTFSHGRFHPLLRTYRPHRGVDFVAKRGTPVRAVGDGRVAYAGWKKGGYGRMIEIRHGSLFRSRYAHLRSLARGIRRGKAVQKGQIIGYVGSSGRSTGPHLHYEFYKDRRYLDPLKVEFPAEDRIEPALRKLFENAKQLYLAELDATPHS